MQCFCGCPLKDTDRQCPSCSRINPAYRKIGISPEHKQVLYGANCGMFVQMFPAAAVNETVAVKLTKVNAGRLTLTDEGRRVL